MTPAEADRLAIATAERDRARAIAVALEQRLARVEAIVQAAEAGLSTTPLDCTDNCWDGPCDCSRNWRVLSWSVDMPALRHVLEADQ